VGDHNDITHAAVQVLPEWQKALLRDQAESLIDRYCCYPDWAYPWSPEGEQKAEAAPYQYHEEGWQYHYWARESANPGENLVRCYEIDPLEYYGFFSRGADFFFEAVASCVTRGEMEDAAKYAGSLLHAHQDPGTNIHCLEGRFGLDWRAVESLFFCSDQPFGPLNSAMSDYLGVARCANGISIKGYQPKLLGKQPAEAAFHLFRRHVELSFFARSRIIPVIQRARRGAKAKAEALLRGTEEETARVSADILFTSLSIASQRFSELDTDRLQTVDLSAYPPVDAPALLSAPYRFAPVAQGYCPSLSGEKVPLRLRVRNGGDVSELATGLGTGCHAMGYRIVYPVPRDTYATFSCRAGLHADLSTEQSAARLAVRFDGRVCWESELMGSGGMGEEIAFPVDTGGYLELMARDLSNDGYGNPHTHVVWGELLLRK